MICEFLVYIVGNSTSHPSKVVEMGGKVNPMDSTRTEIPSDLTRKYNDLVYVLENRPFRKVRQIRIYLVLTSRMA